MKAAKAFEEKHGIAAMKAMVLHQTQQQPYQQPYGQQYHHVPYPLPSLHAGRRYGPPPGRQSGRGRGGHGYPQQQGRGNPQSGHWQATPHQLPFT